MRFFAAFCAIAFFVGIPHVAFGAAESNPEYIRFETDIDGRVWSKGEKGHILTTDTVSFTATLTDASPHATAARIDVTHHGHILHTCYHTASCSGTIGPFPDRRNLQLEVTAYTDTIGQESRYHFVRRNHDPYTVFVMNRPPVERVGGDPEVDVEVTPAFPDPYEPITVTVRATSPVGIDSIAIESRPGPVDHTFGGGHVCRGTDVCSFTYQPNAGRWNRDDIENNYYWIKPRVLDAAGQYPDALGAPIVKVYVSDDFTLPRGVDLVRPEVTVDLSPHTLAHPDTAVVTAEAEDASGIAEMRLYLRDELIRTCPNATRCSATVGPFDPSGGHHARVVGYARDTAGNERYTSNGLYLLSQEDLRRHFAGEEAKYQAYLQEKAERERQQARAAKRQYTPEQLQRINERKQAFLKRKRERGRRVLERRTRERRVKRQINSSRLARLRARLAHRKSLRSSGTR